MGEAIGQLLPLAAVVGLSPFPIIGVVLMLTSANGRRNGWAFLAGWVIGLGLVGAIVLLLAGDADASDPSGPATWVGIVRILLGLALVGLAAKYWRSRPAPGAEPKLPGWMASVSDATAARAAGLAFVLAAVNPKCLLLTVGAAVTIAQTGIGTADQIISLAVYVVIGSVGVIVPVSLHTVAGERAASALAAIKSWMAANNNTVMTVMFAIIGIKVLGDAISGLWT